MAEYVDKDTFLDTFLKNAVFDGWTSKAIRNTEKSLNLMPHASCVAFPAGVEDVIKHFVATIDKQMATEAKKQNIDAMGVTKRIASLVMIRIQLLEPHKEAVKKLVGYFALPHHKPIALKYIAQTSDEMWHLAGDTSTDFNFYSKRFLLGLVYSSTLVFWVNDESEDLAATEAFMQRRLDDVMKIPKAKAKLMGLFSKANPFQAQPS